ncbi:hypothetical protein DFH27DRAFT_521948 [Peziza echinospora]|nr:hypothetical protein DFH27DRAFT_521948 [Peziza echinospora]
MAIDQEHRDGGSQSQSFSGGECGKGKLRGSTWQDSDGGKFEVPTNVTRLSRAIKPIAMVDGKAVQQIVYYQSGVGTGSGGAWSRVVGGATGGGLSEHVREAYGFLANNFHSGDSIILIGFSRGAYTARAIAGLINRIGILTRKAMDDFYKIYAEYRDKTRPIPPYIDIMYHRNDGDYFHRDSRYVTAVACFDTVGSLGIPGSIWKSTGFNEKYEFRDTGINIGKIGHAFHALALDERRASFTPTIWEVPPITATRASDAASISLAHVTQVRQCWFPGVHTNVGGGYEDQEIADVTLAWMVEMLQTVAGALEFCQHYLDYIVKNENGHSSGEWAEGMIYDSVTGLFRLGSKTYRTPGQYGKIPGQQTVAGECIHSSVRVRMQRMAEAAKLDKKIKPWVPPALQGWEFVAADGNNDTTSLGAKWKWIKRAKDGSIEMELEEPCLGKMEKKIAGRRVIEKYFGKEEWDLEEGEVANECIGHGREPNSNVLVESAIGSGASDGKEKAEEMISQVVGPGSTPAIHKW